MLLLVAHFSLLVAYFVVIATSCKWSFNIVLLQVKVDSQIIGDKVASEPVLCFVDPGTDDLQEDAQANEKDAGFSVDNDNEVDDVFTSCDLFSPDRDLKNLKFKELLESEVAVPIPESAEDFVLQVARDVAKLDLLDEKEDDLEDVFKKSMDVDMIDAGVVCCIFKLLFPLTCYLCFYFLLDQS